MYTSKLCAGTHPETQAEESGPKTCLWILLLMQPAQVENPYHLRKLVLPALWCMLPAGLPRPSRTWHVRLPQESFSQFYGAKIKMV